MTDLTSHFSSRSDLHQSPMHADLMRSIDWQVEGLPGSQIFYRTLGPLTLAKIQRPKTLDLIWLKNFRRTHRTLTTYLEPGITHSLPPTGRGFLIEPFAHSCTSLLDLSLSSSGLLASFSQKTRYNITHSLKKDQLHVTTTSLRDLTQPQKTDFFTLHAIWSKQKNVIGYSRSLLDGIITSFKDSGDLHLAYLGDVLVASLLILYHDHVASYWAAFSLPSGYKSFAPTLLTWRALEQAKLNHCDIFDFGGIYDSRYPKMYKKWIGFTKFKSGFNPTVISYPPTSLQLFW